MRHIYPLTVHIIRLGECCVLEAGPNLFKKKKKWLIKEKKKKAAIQVAERRRGEQEAL